jgi:hypothetical protein
MRAICFPVAWWLWGGCQAEFVPLVLAQAMTLDAGKECFACLQGCKHKVLATAYLQPCTAMRIVLFEQLWRSCTNVWRGCLFFAIFAWLVIKRGQKIEWKKMTMRQ